MIMLSHYDRRIISAERWPKREKARGVCTSNKPVNKLIDGFIYFYDTPPPIIIMPVKQNTSIINLKRYNQALHYG